MTSHSDFTFLFFDYSVIRGKKVWGVVSTRTLENFVKNFPSSRGTFYFLCYPAKGTFEYDLQNLDGVVFAASFHKFKTVKNTKTYYQVLVWKGDIEEGEEVEDRNMVLDAIWEGYLKVSARSKKLSETLRVSGQVSPEEYADDETLSRCMETLSLCKEDFSSSDESEDSDFEPDPDEMEYYSDDDELSDERYEEPDEDSDGYVDDEEEPFQTLLYKDETLEENRARLPLIPAYIAPKKSHRDQNFIFFIRFTKEQMEIQSIKSLKKFTREVGARLEDLTTFSDAVVPEKTAKHYFWFCCRPKGKDMEEIVVNETLPSVKMECRKEPVGYGQDAKFATAIFSVTVEWMEEIETFTVSHHTPLADFIWLSYQKILDRVY